MLYKKMDAADGDSSAFGSKAPTASILAKR